MPYESNYEIMRHARRIACFSRSQAAAMAQKDPTRSYRWREKHEGRIIYGAYMGETRLFVLDKTGYDSVRTWVDWFYAFGHRSFETAYHRVRAAYPNRVCWARNADEAALTEVLTRDDT